MLPQFVGATAHARRHSGCRSRGTGGRRWSDLWLTPGAHLVHYPVRGGAEIAVVVIAREDWQGQDWEVEADKAALLARLGDFHASLTQVLARGAAVAQMGTLPPAAAAPLVGRPRHADGRRRAPDAALSGARRRAGAGRRSRARRLPQRPSRDEASAFRAFESTAAAAAPSACKPSACAKAASIT
jgi:hypothetical protein